MSSFDLLVRGGVYPSEAEIGSLAGQDVADDGLERRGLLSGSKKPAPAPAKPAAPVKGPAKPAAPAKGPAKPPAAPQSPARPAAGTPAAKTCPATKKGRQCKCRDKYKKAKKGGRRIKKRAGSSSGSDDGPLVEEEGNKVIIWMGGKSSNPSTKAMEVAGVNGCTALFLFGATGRTAAHLTGDDEVREAKAAADEAIARGNTQSVYIEAPDSDTATKVHDAVAAKIPKATYTVRTYRMLDANGEQCYLFNVAAGSTSVVKSVF